MTVKIRSVTVWAKYLSTFERSYVALLQNDMDYYVLRAQ